MTGTRIVGADSGWTKSTGFAPTDCGKFEFGWIKRWGVTSLHSKARHPPVFWIFVLATRRAAGPRLSNSKESECFHRLLKSCVSYKQHASTGVCQFASDIFFYRHWRVLVPPECGHVFEILAAIEKDLLSHQKIGYRGAYGNSPQIAVALPRVECGSHGHGCSGQSAFWIQT